VCDFCYSFAREVSRDYSASSPCKLVNFVIFVRFRVTVRTAPTDRITRRRCPCQSANKLIPRARRPDEIIRRHRDVTPPRGVAESENFDPPACYSLALSNVFRRPCTQTDKGAWIHRKLSNFCAWSRRINPFSVAP